jgi:hypothetical protein
MERFDTLTEAAEYAVTLCKSFRFATSDERYDAKSLLILAETSDGEDPVDEGYFYVVSDSGAIGLCEDREFIDWLFLSEAEPNEDLPITYRSAPQIIFCSKCGTLVVPGARFCVKCGVRL